ncbi:ankyrin repeat ph and sec7 domain containing protein secg-related [Anaeramoeba flamelloides]|uniref:Ankyrin repeat ph and sec7 domain containing protein secg-related n=1 Tax=Anaeramoeba flamelloides TaxID=1746091 RepID=A0AAV7ZT95_9EUKA|nr:ankyrin repeat ph and sec7 domain containing protein secg-related [Anaeramoeba flamelloides]
MEQYKEIFTKHPFVLKKNNYIPNCQKCKFEESSIYCTANKELLCYNCYINDHQPNVQLFFDLQKNIYALKTLQQAFGNLYKNSSSDNQRNQNGEIGIKYICLCELTDINLINFFFSSGFNQNKNINKETEENSFHLLCSTRNISFERIELFLKMHGDVNKENNLEQTPFQLLFYHNLPVTTEIIKLFIKKGIDLNKQDKYGNTILHSLFIQNEQKGDDYNDYENENENKEEKEKEEYERKYQIIKYILDNGANPNIKNKKKKTPLHILCKKSTTKSNKKQKYGLIKLLFDKGYKIKRSRRNESSELQILFDVNIPKLQIVKLFVEKGINLNQRDKGGDTVLHSLCRNARIEEKEEKNIKLFKYFLDQEINLNICNVFNRTSFDLLCRNISAKYSYFKIFLDKISQKKIQETNDKLELKSSLHGLCQTKNNPNMNVKLVKLFCDYGVDINIDDKSSYTAFQKYCAAGNSDIEIINFFLNSGYIIKSRGKTCFHHYCENNSDLETIKLFLKFGANPIQTNFNQYSPFIYICKLKPNLEILKLFLKKGAKLMSNYNSSRIPFNYICQGNPSLEILKYCIRKGANFNTGDQLSRTAFDYLCSSHSENELIQFALLNGANPNFQNKFKKSCFMSYLSSNPNPNIETIQLFLQKNANINQKCKFGKSCFHYLCLGNPNLSVIKFFVKSGAKMNDKDNDNKLPLHFLCLSKNPNPKILKYFLKYTKDINTKDSFFRTPIQCLALYNNNIKVFEPFLKYEVVLVDNIESGSNVIKSIIKNECVLDLVCLLLQYASNYKKNEGIFSTRYFRRFITLYSRQKNRPLLKQLIDANYNAIHEDFKGFLRNKEFTDYEIKGIKVHKFYLEWRTQKKIEDIKTILEKYEKKDINVFLKWIYYDKNPSDDETDQDHKKITKNRESGITQRSYGIHMYLDFDKEEEEWCEKGNEKKREKEKEKEKEKGYTNLIIFEKILSQFNLQIDPKKYNLKLSMEKLYKDEKSKKFTILLNGINKEIKVHKFILQSRSGLFRKMFSNINDPNIDQIQDFYGLSIEAMQILIKYLYTGNIERKKLNDEIINELLDTADYYQLNPNCSFNYLIGNYGYPSSKYMEK